MNYSRNNMSEIEVITIIKQKKLVKKYGDVMKVYEEVAVGIE